MPASRGRELAAAAACSRRRPQILRPRQNAAVKRPTQGSRRDATASLLARAFERGLFEEALVEKGSEARAELLDQLLQADDGVFPLFRLERRVVADDRCDGGGVGRDPGALLSGREWSL